MGVGILLASDFHLGMKFASLPEVQTELAEARFDCLKRVVDAANARKADMLVVAGDLFHRTTLPKKDIQRAAGILSGFQGAIAAVLPGNHDYLSAADEMWKRFMEAAGSSVLLLADERPYPLSGHGLDVCLYPGPCGSLHSRTNALSWMKGAEKDKNARIHIGIAHGSLEGVSPDFKAEYFPMTASELASLGMDLWLLGHTHTRYPAVPDVRDRIFISGTPEPDGFDCVHEGSAWLLRVEEKGRIDAEPIRTGAHRFVHESVRVTAASDLAAFEKRLSVPEARATLLKAVLTGRLPPEARGELEECRRKLAAEYLHLSWDADGVREEVTAETVAREFAEGSFPYRLLEGLLDAGDTEALETAYELLQEARR